MKTELDWPTNGDRVLKALFFAVFVTLFLVIGCGEEGVVTDNDAGDNATFLPEGAVKDYPENDLVNQNIPEQVAEAIKQLEQGMEEKDTELYLGVFWEDDFFYYSDMTTDVPADDVAFDTLAEEQDSIERLFADFSEIDLEFGDLEFAEVSDTEFWIRNHYRLLVFIGVGKALPGGFDKIFAEGDNIFTFRKRGDEWRISRWEQEEMSQNEMHQECLDEDICPPGDALLQGWGFLKF